MVRAGIGTIGLIDDDIVNLSNIHRQSLFNSKDVKKPKVIVAAKNLKKLIHLLKLELINQDLIRIILRK